MTTKSLTLNLPTPLARELDGLGTELLTDLLQRGLRQWRIDQALERFASGTWTFAAAAEQAKVSRSELAREAHARGIEPPASSETLAEELG